ncbi:ComEA family DNA-binding protein [Paenibacillus bouchesdurhonensis]|uniref:ComEA family DNA-binding protein n=1 Tax=Paenibacillus bouchesdurhonensis TaxID=1870990 RepID=UPI001F3E35DE|nr:ComEA family DNA-binding protein [Paenibacillus bouchesdurhonensis]
MELKREYVMTAVISAVIGAGLMLLAVGGSRPAGIEGWMPVNPGVAAALGGNGITEAATAAAIEPIAAESAGLNGSGAGNRPAQLEAESAVSNAGAEAGTRAGEDEGDQADPAKGASAGAVGGMTDAIPSQTSAEPSEEAGLVSVNTANSMQLQTIPGIGERKAQAIIDYRNQHGSFNSLSDLKKVKGIGDKVFQKMKPYIRL